MKPVTMKKLLKDSYGLNVKKIIPKKNIYIIKGADRDFCLKVIRYDYSRLRTILSAILHLQNKGFKYVPEIIETVKGEKYIEFEDMYGYLSYWIPSRESNYDDFAEVMQVTEKLAELHFSSTGFNISTEMSPRIYWFKWLENFKTRQKEIFDFKKRINQKANKSEFDNLYLGILEEEIEIIDETIEELKANNYFERMEKEVFKRGFCHHDFAHHNVLVSENKELYVIDFDYCILDTCLHDLSSLIIRVMKNGKWDIDQASEMLGKYNSVNPIYKNDNKIMAAFIKFPQQFWQLGIQYYWEQQPWGEKFFTDKLKKYIEDKEERSEFIKKLADSGFKFQ